MDTSTRPEMKMRTIENLEKIRISGSGGVWGAIFTIIFKKRVARKLCRIILLHLGQVTFNFHFQKNKKS